MDSPEIRRVLPEEAEELALLEKKYFPDPWSAQSLEDMLKNPLTLYMAAFLDGKPVGYCGTRMVLDEGEILRVVVEEEYRGRQIGSALMEAVLRSAPEIISWNLEVREHNEPAVRLYRKFGFGPVGRRRGYYHNPSEDAVLMQRLEEGRNS